MKTSSINTERFTRRNVKLALTAALLLWLLSNAFGAPIQLAIKRTPTNGARISWNTEVGGLYRLQSGPVAGPWTNAGLLIVGGSPQAEVVVFPTTGARIFRVRESSVDGALLSTNGAAFAGTVQVAIATYSSIASIQYIGLFDVFGDETNVVGVVDVRNLTNRTFTINTAHMANGLHRLQLEIVSTDGPPTSDDVQVIYSDPISVAVSNPISVVSEITTDWKRYLRFTTVFPTGMWCVWVTNSASAVVQSASGSIATSTNTHGEIVVQDETAGRTNVYPDPYFDYAIAMVRNGETSRYSFRSPVTRLDPNLFDDNNIIVEGVVVEQTGIFDPAGGQLEKESMLETVFQTYADFSDPYDFETGRYLRNYEPTNWNRVAPGQNCEGFNDYLLARGPTDLYFFGNCGPGWLISRTTSADMGVSTATLASLALERRPHFVFIDGGNVPKSLIWLLIGTTKQWTRERAYREGRYPRVAFWWEGENFSSFAGANDISADAARFRGSLFESIWHLGVFGNGILPDRMHDEALERVAEQYPSFIAKLRRAGVVGRYPDETYFKVPVP